MELSGNLSERVVTTANVSGRAYNGSHGNGIGYLGFTFSTGYGGRPSWPGADLGSQYIIAGSAASDGIIYRGGGWSSQAPLLRISNRPPASSAESNTLSVLEAGIRGCRTAR
jgi:hypothetical protein